MHVAIVGGGVVGTALAARLAAAPDAEVTLLEREALGSGTTAASAAVFTWQDAHPSAFAHRLRERAWETYGPLVADGTLDFERVGALTVAETGSYAADLREAAATLRGFGLGAETLGADGLEARGVAGGAYRAGLFTPEEGYFDPGQVVAAFADRATADGADLRTGVAVTDVRTDGAGALGVETADGSVEADAVVNAAGPWAPRVNGFVGVDAPLRHTHGPILVLEGGDPTERPFTMFESAKYLRPVGDDGAFVGRYETEYANGAPLDPDDADPVDDAFRAEANALVESAAPDLRGATVADEWVGLRTVTPDGLPLVGETGVPGYFLAAGMSGLGVTFAPAVADALAAELVGSEPISPELRPNRRG